MSNATASCLEAILFFHFFGRFKFLSFIIFFVKKNVLGSNKNIINADIAISTFHMKVKFWLNLSFSKYGSLIFNPSLSLLVLFFIKTQGGYL